MITLTTREMNTLLYLESCLVDQNGRLEAIRMNEEDWAVIEKMKDHITVIRGMSPMVDGRHFTHRVTRFDQTAWEMTHQERQVRAMRTIRRYWEEDLDVG